MARPSFLRWVRFSRQSDGESTQKGSVEDDRQKPVPKEAERGYDPVSC